NAALDDITDAEFAPDLAHVYGPPPIRKRGVSGDHEQPGAARQCGDDLLCHPIGEIVLFGIATHVRERQYCYGGTIGKCKGRSWQFGRARKTMSAKDVNELIAWLKANPNKASAGIGATTFRLQTAFFQKETGTQFTLVPYRGVAPAIQDLVGGQIDLLFSTPDGLPLVRAGSVKAYVATSDTRLALTPDIPIFAAMELPLSFSGFGWYGLFAPKGTPTEIIDRLNAATVLASADPAVGSRLADLGYEIFPREQQTPKALGAFQKAQIEKWWPLIRE